MKIVKSCAWSVRCSRIQMVQCHNWGV